MARAYNITAKQANAERWRQHHANPDKWFWLKVDKSAGPDACWPWLGAINKNRRGYGRLIFKGRHMGAHRMALILASGNNGAGLVACHTCDNPICCNPAHLWWGTHDQNDKDARMKGRKHGTHERKVVLDEVVRLRTEGWKYSELASRYGVNQTSIAKALKRLRAMAMENQDHG